MLFMLNVQFLCKSLVGLLFSRQYLLRDKIY